MNSTSYFYNHSSQWRYETVTAEELLSPMADKSRYTGHLIDFNVRAERMGWLPSAPQLGTNPLTIAGEAKSGHESGGLHREIPERGFYPFCGRTTRKR